MKKIYVLSALLVLFLALPADAGAAPRLFLEPASQNLNYGDSISVTVKVDTDGQETKGASAAVIYPTNLFDFVSVSGGDFYIDRQTNYDEARGWIYVDGYQNNPETRSGVGTLGSFTLKTRAAGTAAVSIDCSGSSIMDTNETNPTNILDCDSSSGGNYPIGGAGGGPDTQPQPTQLPETSGGGNGGNNGGGGGDGGSTGSPPSGGTAPTNTPPAELPQSGKITDLLKTAAIGAGSVILGVLLLL